jgi:hypothetical protein
MSSIEEIMAAAKNKAKQLIEDDNELIYDVAADHCAIVGNVKHMDWFIDAVAMAYTPE